MQQLQILKDKILLLLSRKFYPQEILANPLIRKIWIHLIISVKSWAREFVNPSDVSIGSLESQEPSQQAPSISSDKSQSQQETRDVFREEMNAIELPGKNFG